MAGSISISEITFSSARFESTWEKLNGPPIIEFGFLWGEGRNLSLDNASFKTISNDPSLTNSFQIVAEDLMPETRYFVGVYVRELEVEDINFMSVTEFKTEAKPDPCGGSVADPDLINLFLASSGSIIPQGSRYTLQNTTSNISDSTCFITRTADTSSTWMIVQYRIDNFDPWDTCYAQFFPIDSIQAGETFKDDYGYVFNNPGEYLITTFADGRRRVFERVETNNDHTAGARGTNIAPIDFSVKVIPDPYWNPEKAGFKPGEYVKVIRTRLN